VHGVDHDYAKDTSVFVVEENIRSIGHLEAHHRDKEAIDVDVILDGATQEPPSSTRFDRVFVVHAVSHTEVFDRLSVNFAEEQMAFKS